MVRQSLIQNGYGSDERTRNLGKSEDLVRIWLSVGRYQGVLAYNPARCPGFERRRRSGTSQKLLASANVSSPTDSRHSQKKLYTTANEFYVEVLQWLEILECGEEEKAVRTGRGLCGQKEKFLFRFYGFYGTKVITS